MSKWAKLATVCGVALLTTAGAYSLAPTADGTSAPVGAGAKAGADPLALIRQDSPGARNAVALANKNRPAAVAGRPVAAAGPQPARPANVAAYQPERVSEVLPTAVAAPALAPAAVPAAAAAPLVGAAPLAAAVPVAAAVPTAGIGSGALGFLALPLGLGAFALGDGGGGSPSFAPAVPEPETWLMMILGFGFLGATMRKRRREQRKAMLEGSGLIAA